MKRVNLITQCGNCGEDITKRILDLTPSTHTDIYIDMELEGDGFDCEECGQNTGIMLTKETN